jgi:2-C-methyl-D-erythritol 4-phosphate cytidylyltransferase
VLTAVIAAAGSGERLGAGGPKAFVPLVGRPMIEWSLDAFAGCEAVAAVVVAVPPELADASSPRHPDIRQVGPGDGVTTLVAGGETRAQSVANALQAVDTEMVAIHDAARPLVTPALIEALVADLDANPEAAAVIAASAVTDTVKRSRSKKGAVEVPFLDLEVEATLDRSVLWAAQTPQVFRTAALREALEVDEAMRDAATDEAMLVEAAGGTVLLHPVGAPNLKVTTPDDLRIAELLLSERA